MKIKIDSRLLTAAKGESEFIRGSGIYICLLILGILFLVTGTANAYDFPPYQGLTLKIYGNISESYSNNITFASDQDLKVEDYTTLVNLGLVFQYKGKRQSIGLRGDMKREIFEADSGAQNPSEYVRLDYKNELSDYDLIFVNNSFTHSKIPLKSQGFFDVDECIEENNDGFRPINEVEDLCNEISEEFGRFRGRYDSYRNSANLTYSRIFSEYINVGTSYTYNLNWSDEEGTNDSDYHGIKVNLNYLHSQPTRFSLSYHYRISDYEIGNDIARQEISAGIRQYLTKRIFFDGSIGSDQTIIGNDDDSITGDATLTGELDNTTTAGVSYSQGVTITDSTNDTFENWQTTLRLTKVFLEDLRSSITAFYGEGEYSSSNVRDILLGAGGSISYYFWRSKRGSNLRGTLGYSFSKLDSTDLGREYDRNSIKSSLTASF